MMKWGRWKEEKKKKPERLPSSSSSARRHAFPISSWLSKFKQNCGNFEPRKAKQQGKNGSLDSESLPIPRGSCREGRFYARDDDEDGAFWRISFGEGRETRGEKRESVLYNPSEDDAAEPPWPGFSRSRPRVEGKDFADTVLGFRKMEQLPEENETEAQLRKSEEKGDDTEEFALKRGPNLRTVKEESSFDWQKLKDMKIKEIMSRSKNQEKKYLSQRRRTRKPSCRVRVHSPRTAASKVDSCRIKAIEDMKKARSKMRKRAKAAATGGQRAELESYAVVKCSFDPQADFHDSMVEMITEKRITRARELEELLACYLTLNSDQYHDLIIKVFRQVWFELNQKDGQRFP